MEIIDPIAFSSWAEPVDNSEPRLITAPASTLQDREGVAGITLWLLISQSVARTIFLIF